MKAVGSAGEGKAVQAAPAGISRLEVALSIGWVVVPVVQYAGTLERTGLALGEQPWLPAMALLDLTPVYVVLLVATLAVAALRVVNARETGGHTR